MGEALFLVFSLFLPIQGVPMKKEHLVIVIEVLVLLTEVGRRLIQEKK